MTVSKERRRVPRLTLRQLRALPVGALVLDNDRSGVALMYVKHSAGLWRTLFSFGQWGSLHAEREIVTGFGGVHDGRPTRRRRR